MTPTPSNAYQEYAKSVCEWCREPGYPHSLDGRWHCTGHDDDGDPMFDAPCTAKSLAEWADEIAGELAALKTQHQQYVLDHPLSTKAIQEIVVKLTERTQERDQLARDKAVLADAIDRIDLIYSKLLLPICTRKDHKPFRFPGCSRCQLDARLEEAKAARAALRREEERNV